jgi:uncharacterized membrane protein (DUF485 family)
VPDSDGASRPDPTDRFRWLLHASWFVPSIAVILLVLYSVQFSGSKLMSTLSISLLIALSALVSGLLLGFLFGIPRALQQQSAITTGLDSATNYAVNTNLEQISDWLTKILVGVGLIQFGRIGSQFGKLTTALGASIGTNPVGRLVAGTDIIFFVVWGFLLGYLLTRTYLTAAFRAFDVSEIATRAAKVAATEVTQTAESHKKEQDLIDAKALSLASDVLTPGAASPDLPDGDKVRQFEEALMKASPPIREHIYQMARSQRASTWDWRGTEIGPETAKNRHERTVPVFEALAKAAPGDHRIRGDLGFALKDKTDPDYSESARQLGVAIDLATKQGDQQALAWYSINRVIARITLGNKTGQTAPWPDRTEILADLKRAEAYGGGPGRIAREEMIETWRSQNLQDSSP